MPIRWRDGIASVTGAYDRESDGQNWWHWVKRKVIFKMQPLFVSKDANQVKLRFEYETIGNQTLTVGIIKREATSEIVMLQSQGLAPGIFEKLIDLPPAESELSIETDGIASPLGNNDPRRAAWMVRNVAIRPVS